MEKLGDVEVEGGLSDLPRSGIEHRHNPVRPMSELEFEVPFFEHRLEAHSWVEDLLLLLFQCAAVTISEEIDFANEKSCSTLTSNSSATATM
jgi:hypothetical protein